MTKGEINRLGNIIRNEYNELSDKTLSTLQEYRISHKDTLSTVFNILCNLNKNKISIVTYRIKRIESIIEKLYRYPKMNFSRMWDVGGCRCIVKNNEEVYKLKGLIEKEESLIIKKVYDYIEEPQPEGYRSLHLFLSLKDDDKVIELQIRNEEDHNWATLVEITDLLYDTKLKEYGKDKDLLEFHLLLSKHSDLTIDNKIKIAKIIEKYDYIKKLSDVFSRNYIDIRKQWLEIKNKHRHNYFIIETKKDEIPKISSYEKYEEAEDMYFSIYKNNEKANVVLTHLPKPSYDQISMAYSNYVLTFHSFFDDCYKILEQIVEKTLIERRYIRFFRFFKLYSEFVYYDVRNLMSEIREIEKVIKTKPTKKQKDWIKDINKKVEKRKDASKRMQNSISKNIPKKGMGNRIFIFITKRIIKGYTNKIKNIMDKADS